MSVADMPQDQLPPAIVRAISEGDLTVEKACAAIKRTRLECPVPVLEEAPTPPQGTKVIDIEEARRLAKESLAEANRAAAMNADVASRSTSRVNRRPGH